MGDICKFLYNKVHTGKTEFDNVFQILQEPDGWISKDKHDIIASFYKRDKT